MAENILLRFGGKTERKKKKKPQLKPKNVKQNTTFTFHEISFQYCLGILKHHHPVPEK